MMNHKLNQSKTLENYKFELHEQIAIMKENANLD